MYSEFIKMLFHRPTPEWVESRIKALVQHAYREVPYYRKMMIKAKIVPEQISSLKDFDNFFPTTRADEYKKILLKDKQQVLTSSLMDTLAHVDRSSGSTGIPTTVHRSYKETAHNNAKTLLHLVKRGLRPWDRIAAVVPPIQVVERDSILQRFGLFYRKAIDHYMPIDEATELLISHRINAIYGRKAGIQLLAERLTSHPDFRPFAFMMPGTEVIDNNSRRYLREKYKPKRYAEMYGCTETGIIATRNDENHYKIDYQSVFITLDHIEYLGQGTYRGKVAVTSLYNWLQPFLKYELGDIIVVGHYDQRYNLGMTIIDIEGRSDDFLYLSDGSKMSAATFKCILEEFPFVWQYKIIQKELENCDVQIILTEDGLEHRKKTSDAIGSLLSKRIGYNIHFVDNIPLSKTGKFKVLESDITV